MGYPENQDNELSERKASSNKNLSESDIHLKRLSAVLDEEVADLHIIGFKVAIDNKPAYSFALDKNRSKSVDVLKIFENSDEVFGRRVVQAHEPESGIVRNVFEVADVKDENLPQNRVLDPVNTETNKEAFDQKVVQAHQKESKSARSLLKTPTTNRQYFTLSQLADIRNNRYKEGSPKVPAMELKFHSHFIEKKNFEIHIKSESDRINFVSDNEKPSPSNTTEKKLVDFVKADPARGAAHYIKYFIECPDVPLKNVIEVTSSETQTDIETASSSTQTTSMGVPKQLKEIVTETIQTCEISTATDEINTKSVATETDDIPTKPPAVQTEKKVSTASSQTDTSVNFSVERECNSSTQTEQAEDAPALIDFNISVVDRATTADKSVDTQDLPFAPLLLAKEEKREDEKKQAANEEGCPCSCRYGKQDRSYKCCFHTECVNILPANRMPNQTPSLLAPIRQNCDRCQRPLRGCFETSGTCDEKVKNDCHALYCCVCAQKKNLEQSVGVSQDAVEILKPPEVCNLSSVGFNSLTPNQRIWDEPPTGVLISLESDSKKLELITAVKVFKTLKMEKVCELQMPVIIHHVLSTFTLSKLGPTRAVINPTDIRLSASDIWKKDENSLKPKTKKRLDADTKDKIKKPLLLISEEAKSNSSTDRSVLPPISFSRDSCSQICNARCMTDARIREEHNSLLKANEFKRGIHGKEKVKTSKEKTHSLSPKIKPKAFDYTAKDVWKLRDSTSSEFVSKRMEATDIARVGKTSSQQYFESVKSISINEACEAVNDHILSLRPVDEHKVRKAAELLHKRWFEVAGTKYSDVREIRHCIQYFEEFSNNLVKTLLHSVDSNGNNVLHFAFANNRFDLVDELLNNGFATELLNKRNKSGITPLLVCSTSQPKNPYDWSVVRKCFETGNVNAKSAKFGRTPLMNAAARGFHAMVDLLLDVGANPNLQDRDGSTALMYAAEHGQEKCVKILVRHKKCDPTIQESDGQTACSIALDNGHKNTAILIHMQTLEKRRQSTNPHSNKRYIWTTSNRAKKKALAMVPEVEYF